MRSIRPIRAHVGFVAVLLPVLAVGCGDAGSGTGGMGGEVSIDADDIGGVVTGPDGPEAGVWVIAETEELPTRFVRSVVTDDAGRYVVPDLPDAEYDVWVRGYGLVDSERVSASPGSELDLTAVPAPDEAAAAEIYPAGYWFSLLEVPGAEEFPGTGASGNGLSPSMETQEEFLRNIKSGGCMACHQLGSPGTREIPQEIRDEHESSVDAWRRRILSGQAGDQMLGMVESYGADATLAMFADWTDRIAAGEVPEQPPRPQGVERNVVVTQWDWADSLSYLHDLVSTDRRDPTVNSDGRLYGALELSSDYLPVLDPVNHTIDRVPLEPRDPATEPAASPEMPQPSPYYGETVLWDSRVNVHNPMMDQDGRVWLTATVSPPDNPDYCREGSDHPSARIRPLGRASRHLAVWDPDAEELSHIRTCFSTHHLMFAEDDRNTLYTSGHVSVVGWLDTEQYLETGDEVASQGWTDLILDTNGNGRRDAFVGPDEPVDPGMDKRITPGYVYGISPTPDGSIWMTILTFPGGVVRLVPGDNPPHTALAEWYEVPWENPDAPTIGYGPRGMDVDRNGVVWVPMASGHLASFDRSACEGPLNGPEATGQHCPEGWTFHEEPLPQVRGVDAPGSAEASYYTWVDQFDALGLGANTPINTGNGSEGLLVWDDGEWVVLRVPYPTGFYTKWMDGRIDDPEAGWKGRGLWATVSTRAPFHMETGKGTTSKVAHFQLRPDPLAH